MLTQYKNNNTEHVVIANGVVSGTGNEGFSPNRNLTREQAAVMLADLAKAVGHPISEKAPAFADNKGISTWAVNSVGQMQAADIMRGVGSNQFARKDIYTSEQSIIIIKKLYDVVK